jgi:putative ABC transport system permease protein
VNVKTLLRSAWDSILRNRVRSLLTMLGVIIGVAAVVITISIGVGARVAIAQQITSLGSNLVIVLPGSVNLNGVRTGTGGASTLTVEDGLAIAKLPHVAAASPMVISRAQVISGQNNWQTQIVGVAPTYTYIRQWHLASGSSFTDADVASSAKVCVLGKTVVDNLFLANRQDDHGSQRTLYGRRRSFHAWPKRKRSGSGRRGHRALHVPDAAAGGHA